MEGGDTLDTLLTGQWRNIGQLTELHTQSFGLVAAHQLFFEGFRSLSPTTFFIQH